MENKGSQERQELIAEKLDEIKFQCLANFFSNLIGCHYGEIEILGKYYVDIQKAEKEGLNDHRLSDAIMIRAWVGTLYMVKKALFNRYFNWHKAKRTMTLQDKIKEVAAAKDEIMDILEEIMHEQKHEMMGRGATDEIWESYMEGFWISIMECARSFWDEEEWQKLVYKWKEVITY